MVKFTPKFHFTKLNKLIDYLGLKNTLNNNKVVLGFNLKR